MKTVSIIIPVHNEEDVIESLLARLQSSLKPLKYSFRLIFVDDGSRDKTIEKLLDVQKRDPRVRIVKLTRNWGHQCAFNAGLDFSSGDAVIFMDGDLEDPPELIPDLLAKWEEGFSVVNAIKLSRQESRFKKFLFSAFYELMRVTSHVPIEKHGGMFSLLDAKVVRHLKLLRERNKYYVGLKSFLGFNSTKVFYHREKRFAGKPKQSFFKLIQQALDALFSFSFVPVRMIGVIGLTIIFLIIAFSVILIIARVGHIRIFGIDNIPYGWTSLVLLMFFLFGMLAVFIAVLGEYIARIFDEVKGRPNYVVEEAIGFEPQEL